MNEAATLRLAERARADLAALSYPDAGWVEPRRTAGGDPVLATIVVGAGQSGLAIAAALRRDGVNDIAVLDRAPAGQEGVWEAFARMEELRTPKLLNGMEFGCPSLSVEAWYTARHGAAAWRDLDRIPRPAWAAYLRWYRATLGIPVESGTAVTDIRAGPDGTLAVEARCGPTVLRRVARTVVIATGFDGAGAWRVPEIVSRSLASDRYDHTNGPVDFTRLRGARVAVLGHGASAFDNANRALEAGASRVDLCFRRDRLPRVNPHRHLENAGTMTHYPWLDPRTRWRIARHFRYADQPPPRRALEAALAHPRFRLHPASPWLSVREDHDGVAVETPRAILRCDHLLCATGIGVDLASRPELTSLASAIALWRDRYEAPVAEADDRLAAYPFLDTDFSFMARRRDDAWVAQVFCFNGAAAVSHGPHATSISGHRHALPRLVRGVTGRLFAQQAAGALDRLAAYADIDLALPDDFEARHHSASGH